MKAIAYSALLASYIFVSSVATEAQTLTKIGAWTEGVTLSLAENEGVVYFSNGTWIESLDIADPENPVRLGRINMREGTQRLIANGSALYVDQGRRIVVLDISNPAVPVSVDSVAAGYESLILDGDQLIGGRDQWIEFIDISHPFHPGEPEPVSVPIRSHGLEVSGNILYATTQHGEAYVYNIDDQANPALLTTITKPRVQSVAVHDDRLYFAGDSLYVFDVSDPADPTQVYSVAGYRHHFVFQDEVMYSFDLNARLFVYDISDPDMPVEIGDYWPDIKGNTSFGGDGAAVFKVGYTVLADAEFGVYIIDTTDPSDLSTIARVGTGGHHQYAEKVGDQMLLSSSAAGMTVLDVSEPTNPRVHQRLPQVTVPVQSETSGDFAFVAGRPSTVLQRIDGDWTDLGLLDMFAGDVDVSGDRAYFLSGSVQVLNISALGAPVPLGNFGSFNSPRALEVSGDTVFVDESNEGVHVFDAADLADVRQIAHLELPGYGWELVAEGNTLLAARHTADIQLIDLTDVSSPQITALAGTYRFRDFARVEGALLGLNAWGIWAFDENGIELTATLLASVPGSCQNLDSEGDIVYALSSDEGIHVFRFQGVETSKDPVESADPVLSISVYPNPFFDGAKIQVQLDRPRDVRIEIFDILGRNVRTVHNGFLAGGAPTVPWDGSDGTGSLVAPGVYFVKIIGASDLATISLVKSR